MAILSKPYKVSIQLLGAYLSSLYLNPIKTKSITAATIAMLGNFTSQRLSGAQSLDVQTLGAFGLFGLLFGGSVPHFFYEGLQRIVNEESKFAPLYMLLIERLVFMPVYQFFSLYTLARFEMKSHSQALANVTRFYPPIVEANFKYLTLLQFMNLYFVPPMLRVLVANLIGFFWVIYLARKRTPPSRKTKSGRP